VNDEYSDPQKVFDEWVSEMRKRGKTDAEIAVRVGHLRDLLEMEDEGIVEIRQLRRGSTMTVDLDQLHGREDEP
jgi:hypothetical protein